MRIRLIGCLGLFLVAAAALLACSPASSNNPNSCSSPPGSEPGTYTVRQRVGPPEAPYRMDGDTEVLELTAPPVEWETRRGHAEAAAINTTTSATICARRFFRKKATINATTPIANP